MNHDLKKRMRTTVAAVAILGIGMLATFAPASGDPLTSETFQNAAVTTATAWAEGGAGGAATGWPGLPCLTAGTNTAQTPVAGCISPAIDAAGSGALRLTGADLNRSGDVFNTAALTTAGGLDITFHQAQYGGTAVSSSSADGISFFLVDGSTSSTSPGGLGGALGYGNTQFPKAGSPGLANGVAKGLLGIGLDAFGNYSNPYVGGTDCAAGTGAGSNGPGRTINSVAVRGAGDGATGYCWLGSSGALSRATFPMGDSASGTGTRATRDILVHIVFDPANTVGATRNVTVFLNGTQVVQVPAPAALLSATSFKFGFAASTGSASDVHEVWGLVIASVAPLPPTNLACTPGAGTLACSWTPPTNPGNGPVTGYTATATSGSTTKTCAAAAAATGCTITGLPAGTFTVTVTASNASGTSAPSDPPITVTLAVGATPALTG